MSSKLEIIVPFKIFISIFIFLSTLSFLIPLTGISRILLNFSSFSWIYWDKNFLNWMVAQMVKHLPAMWETQDRSLGREDPLEKEMATHSSTLAWKIPWMEEPGTLQSMGLQRVGHDWATSLHHSRSSRINRKRYYLFNILLVHFDNILLKTFTSIYLSYVDLQYYFSVWSIFGVYYQYHNCFRK